MNAIECTSLILLFIVLSEETSCLWFETLHVDSTVLMTEAVKLEYFEEAINETDYKTSLCSNLQ